MSKLKIRKLKTSGWIGFIILIILGLYYTVIPHSIHIKSELTWLIFEIGLNHLWHVIIGLIFLIIAILLIIKKK